MKALRHVGIVVRDLERSLRFYRDLLGLTVVRTMEEHGDVLDRILARQNTRVTTVKLVPPTGGMLVELLAFESHPTKACSEDELLTAGVSHLAFTVENLDMLYERLSGAGVRFHAPPQTSLDGHVKVTFCRDPDGTPIELVEERD